jgi:hypothetical protein
MEAAGYFVLVCFYLVFISFSGLRVCELGIKWASFGGGDIHGTGVSKGVFLFF